MAVRRVMMWTILLLLAGWMSVPELRHYINDRAKRWNTVFKGALLSLVLGACVAAGAESSKYDYRLLATSKTSTMEKEMNEAADAGYAYSAVMGGETALGGDEVVVVMAKNTSNGKAVHKKYKLLATSKTSTMQKEMQQAGDEGFEYKGQSVFQSAFGGREVAVIMERDMDAPPAQKIFRLLATSKTSTMQKELVEAGGAGFRLLGLTVAKTAFGGSEVVSILCKE